MMESEEGKLKLARLNEINLRVQQLEWNLNVEKMKYAYECLLYRGFLGYELTEEELKELNNLDESLSKIEGVYDEAV